MEKNFPGVRHLLRQVAFQTLFQMEINPTINQLDAIYYSLAKDAAAENNFNSIEEILSNCLPQRYRNVDIVRDSTNFLNELLQGVKEHQEELDQKIDEHMTDWKISRINRTHLVILRIAVYELLYMTDTDPSIVMNEAIELAKEFSDQKSSKFINGVLQGVQNSKKEA